MSALHNRLRVTFLCFAEQKLTIQSLLSVIFPDTAECKRKVGRWATDEKFELSVRVFVYHIQLNAKWEYFPNRLKRWGHAQN